MKSVKKSVKKHKNSKKSIRKSSKSRKISKLKRSLRKKQRGGVFEFDNIKINGKELPKELKDILKLLPTFNLDIKENKDYNINKLKKYILEKIGLDKIGLDKIGLDKIKDENLKKNIELFLQNPTKEKSEDFLNKHPSIFDNLNFLSRRDINTNIETNMTKEDIDHIKDQFRHAKTKLSAVYAFNHSKRYGKNSEFNGGNNPPPYIDNEEKKDEEKKDEEKKDEENKYKKTTNISSGVTRSSVSPMVRAVGSSSGSSGSGEAIIFLIGLILIFSLLVGAFYLITWMMGYSTKDNGESCTRFLWQCGRRHHCVNGKCELYDEYKPTIKT